MAMNQERAGGLRLSADRRQALQALSAVPLSALLRNPAFAAATASAHDEVTLVTPSGHEVRASYVLPLKQPAPAIVLFHEWWGLNNQIKTVAVDLAAKQGYVVLALDFFNREVATTAAEAGALMKGLNEDLALEITLAWIAWLRTQDSVNGRIGTLGWCMGGGWSLAASIATPIDATVVYYGNVARTAAELRKLKGPVLGQFAKRDQWINAEMVAAFTAAMKEAGKSLTSYWYDADHAFANPTGANYDAADAALAWERTTAFLAKNLKG